MSTNLVVLPDIGLTTNSVTVFCSLTQEQFSIFVLNNSAVLIIRTSTISLEELC